ncbi:GNAT family N-acetyltransferase [Nostoc sp. UHCC 0252]|uniref:GNAT family N-acetyltransferase n=1 Tax=Nostoc sp. UHCC 0252 TaxID=3110241 RepID=UPI002B20423A|nr:GNAT family N-acetyltransferase [Nostoc sp. UHCC 0252]MEA5602040.1 GNAT family N-acetyltransferase [Nostoc sp. UHCC 0252]
MITVQVEQEVTQQDRMTVIQMIRQFNQNFFPLSKWQPVAVFARDESGLIVGGVMGEIGCNWLYIRVLVVQEGLRGKGIGSNILKIAEKEGQKQNCVGVHLETLDFQAKEFYESQGYTVFGFQENYPLGHKRYFMQKLFNLS